jgi:amphi-Trp domain-containing protein
MPKIALSDKMLIASEAPELPERPTKQRKKSKDKRVENETGEKAPVNMEACGTDRDIRKKSKLSYDAHLSKEEVGAYLDAVAVGLRQGRIKMCHEGKCLELLPAADLSIDISAVQKGTRQRFAFEVSWRLPDDE